MVPPARTAAVPVLVHWRHTTRTLAESERMPPYWASITRTTAASAGGVNEPVWAASRAASGAATPSARARAAAGPRPPCPGRQVPSASTSRTALSFAAGWISPGPGSHRTTAGSAPGVAVAAAGLADGAPPDALPPDAGAVGWG